MLPKAQRLSRTQFLELIENPTLRTIYNRLGTLKYVHASLPTLSVVTSSKHEKNAVKRNKLRRRIYGIFPRNSTIEAVVYLSKQSYQMEYSEIKSLFYELLQKTTK